MTNSELRFEIEMVFKYLECILRKTIEGFFFFFFNFITFEKMISNQSIFVSDRRTNMQFSKNAKQNLRVIGYDKVPRQMLQPSLPKVRKQ